MRNRIALLAVIAAACLPMMADEVPTEWHGYTRIGTGVSSNGGEAVAFQLPGTDHKYRFGNETENYGEFQVDSTIYDKDGTTFKFHLMPNFNQAWNSSVSNAAASSWNVGIAQVYMEGKGILGASSAFKDADIWVGERYYNRRHIELNDFFYVTEQGHGFGIENIDLGNGKLSYAFMELGNGSNPNPAATVPSNGTSSFDAGYSHDLRVEGIGVNPNGALTIGLQFAQAKPVSTATYNSSTFTNSGFQAYVEHHQDKLFGMGDNTFVLQYGKGAEAGMTNNVDGTLGTGTKGFRVDEFLNLQPNNVFGMIFAAEYEQDQDINSNKSTWTSFGFRPMVFLTPHFSIVGDVGYDSVKYADNTGAGMIGSGVANVANAGKTGNLTKSTIALVWRPEAQIYSVPQLRLFYTNASWNDVANQAGTISGGLFPTKTSGANYGLQGELWF